MSLVTARQRKAAARTQTPEPGSATPPDQILEPVDVDYSSWSKTELKDALRARDLPVSGTKAELIARLEE